MRSTCHATSGRGLVDQTQRLATGDELHQQVVSLSQSIESREVLRACSAVSFKIRLIICLSKVDSLYKCVYFYREIRGNDESGFSETELAVAGLF